MSAAGPTPAVLFVEDRPWPAFGQLAAVLGRHGIVTARVILGTGTRHRPHVLDRLVWRRQLALSAGEDPAPALSALLDGCRLVGVHAVESAAAAAIVRAAGWAAGPLDKRTAATRLTEAGVEAPAQLAGGVTCASEAAATLGLPIVVKPVWGNGGGGVTVAATASAAEAAGRSLSGPWVYERWVEGDALSVGALADERGVRLAAAYRRIQPPGDVRPASVVVPVDAQAWVGLAGEVGDALGLTGLYCFDLVVDRAGRSWVHDVNARVWSSFGVFRPSVDFGEAYARWLIGGGAPPQATAPAGPAVPVFPAGWRHATGAGPSGAVALGRWAGSYLRWLGPGYLAVEVAARSQRA